MWIRHNTSIQEIVKTQDTTQLRYVKKQLCVHR
jgi:hypothetical protein